MRLGWDITTKSPISPQKEKKEHLKLSRAIHRRREVAEGFEVRHHDVLLVCSTPAAPHKPILKTLQ